MKKIVITLSVFFFSLVLANAQVSEDMYTVKDGAVIVEKVVPFTVSKDDASAAVKSFFLKKLKNSNEAMKNSTDDYYVVKIITSELATHSMGFWHTMGELTIDVRFKENRMKVSIACGNIINSNKEGTSRKNYNPTEAAPLSKHDSWKTGIVQNAAEQTFNKLVLWMTALIEELNTAVQNAEAENDW